MALPKMRAVITADTKQAEAGFDRAAAGLDRVGDAADRASTRSNQFSARLSRSVSTNRRFALGVQNASFQLGDFATQVGAGTSASIALGQQLPQLLGGFGVLGAVLGAVVAVGVPLTRVMGDLSDQGRDMTEVFGTLQPVMTSIADAMRTVAGVFVSAAELVINNLDRILITAGGVAAFFAARFVAGFVAARVATFSLSAALVTLRAALIRTGIGALIVGAGELAFQFSRVARAAGGVGEAIGLIGSVFSEMWSRIRSLSDAGVKYLVGRFGMMQSAFINAIGKMAVSASDFFFSLSQGLADVPGMQSLADQFDAVSTSIIQSGSALSREAMRVRQDAQSQLDAAMEGFQSGTGPLESVQKIRDLLASMKDERITLGDILGGGGDNDGQGDGPTKDVEKQTAALQGLRDQGRATWGALGDFIGQFASKSKAAAIAQIAIQKGLAIAQIQANSAAAQVRALAELGPIAGPAAAAKIAGFAQLQSALVAATGLAQASQAGGGGGGGGGSLGGGAVAAQAAPSPLEVRLTGLGANDLLTGADVGSLLERLTAEAGDRGLRLTVAR